MTNIINTNRDEPGDIVAAVRAEIEASGLSQSAVAKESGVGKSALNRWLKGLYAGDSEAVDEKMARWVEARYHRRQAQAELPAAPAWFETQSARQVLSALSYAQMAGDIAVIYGGAGVGKTLSAQRYRGQAPNVWIATMTPATSVLGSALERIALTVGLRPTGRAARIEGEIVERLDGTQGLLIIDEAQHLGSRALEAIRSLQDATGVGVAIMGNEVVYTQLIGGKRSMAFAQMFSRIGKRVRLTRPKQADVDALVDAWQISDSATRKLCSEIAKKPGALRVLTKTLRLAAMFAAGQDSALEMKHVRAAYRDLGGE